MKKIITIIIAIFAFALVSNAKESWKISEFKFSEDVGITDIIYDPIMTNEPVTPSWKAEDSFTALGNEYSCASSNETCNVYRIDANGKVIKANKYYDNTNRDFPGYIHYKLEKGNDGKLTSRFYSKTFDPSKESPMDSVIAKSVYENMTFNYLKCVTYDKEYTDICIIGYEKDSVQYYGIISSDGEYEGEEGYIIDPKSSYALVFDSNDSPNFAALQDDTYYYIVSGNGNVEKIEKSFFENNDFDIESVELLNYDDDINYYSFTGTPCPVGQNCIQVVTTFFFTKNGISPYREAFSTVTSDSSSIYIFNNNPLIVTPLNLTGFPKIYINKWNGDRYLEDAVYCASIRNDVLSYNKDNKLIVNNGSGTIITDQNRTENVCRRLVDGDSFAGIYLFVEGYNSSLNPGDWKPKYYLLSKAEADDPTEDPTSPDKPKYTCKKVDNKFYDKNGKVVTKNEFENSCPEAVPDTGAIIPIAVIGLLGAGFITFKKKKLLINKI